MGLAAKDYAGFGNSFRLRKMDAAMSALNHHLSLYSLFR
jgi:hypothetical protein